MILHLLFNGGGKAISKIHFIAVDSPQAILRAVIIPDLGAGDSGGHKTSVHDTCSKSIRWIVGRFILDNNIVKVHVGPG